VLQHASEGTGNTSGVGEVLRPVEAAHLPGDDEEQATETEDERCNEGGGV
jgi:hypothetical protein